MYHVQILEWLGIMTGLTIYITSSENEDDGISGTYVYMVII